jgi:hypothetical protein
MRQVQINKPHQGARVAGRETDSDPIPLDPRDPDVVRAKRRLAESTSAGEGPA